MVTQISSNKNLTIETWRGIAILAVVIGHVIGEGVNDGMKIDDPSSPFRYLHNLIYYIHMPLFTALAGWVYALKPIGDRSYFSFMGDKFKRLIVPMITVSTIYYLLQNMVPGTNAKEPLSEIWRIYLFPYTFYWYLKSLFVIFAIIALVDRYSKVLTMNRWSIMLVLSIVLYLLHYQFTYYNAPNVFGFQGALDQLPYFIVGIGVQRFGKELYNRFTAGLYILAALGVGWLCYKYFISDINMVLYKSLVVLGVIPTLIILLNMKFTSKIFIYLGAYAYTIYLLHGFGTSGGRIILSKCGINSDIAIFWLSLLLGVFAPILVDKILSRSRYLRFIFLGKRL